jgi:hypothetical protein
LGLFMRESIMVGNGAQNAYGNLSWYHWVTIVHFHGGRVKGRLSAIDEKRERSTKIKRKEKKIKSRVAIPVSLQTKPSCVVRK